MGDKEQKTTPKRPYTTADLEKIVEDPKSTPREKALALASLMTRQKQIDNEDFSQDNTQSGFHFIPDAQDWKDMIYVGGYYLESGVHNSADWSKKVIEFFGDGVKPHLDELWRRVKNEFRRLNVLPDIEEEAKLESENRKELDGSKMGVKPTQALLFDGLIQRDSYSRPKGSAPQHTEVSGGEQEEIHTEEPKQEEPAQIKPHTPSEQTKKVIEKYKRDRKAGKVKPLIPPSQRKPNKVMIGDGLSDGIYLPDGMSKDFCVSNKIINADEFREASNRLHNKHGDYLLLPDAQDWKDMLYIGLYYFEGGIREFQIWTEVMTKIMGEDVEPHLDELWKRTQKEYHRQMALPEPEEYRIDDDFEHVSKEIKTGFNFNFDNKVRKGMSKEFSLLKALIQEGKIELRLKKSLKDPFGVWLYKNNKTKENKFIWKVLVASYWLFTSEWFWLPFSIVLAIKASWIFLFCLLVPLLMAAYFGSIGKELMISEAQNDESVLDALWENQFIGILSKEKYEGRQTPIFIIDPHELDWRSGIANIAMKKNHRVPLAPHQEGVRKELVGTKDIGQEGGQFDCGLDSEFYDAGVIKAINKLGQYVADRIKEFKRTKAKMIESIRMADSPEVRKVYECGLDTDIYDEGFIEAVNKMGQYFVDKMYRLEELSAEITNGVGIREEHHNTKPFDCGLNTEIYDDLLVETLNGIGRNFQAQIEKLEDEII